MGMRHFKLPAAMNVLVPGTGLMALGRPWLGLALAIWFGLGSEIALIGLLLAPASIPTGLVVVAAGLAVIAWLIAQGLLVSRIRFLRDPNLAEELAGLQRLAETALARGDHRAARSALAVALAIDDSEIHTRVLWAKLMEAMGKASRARQAWRDVARLDEEGEFAQQVASAGKARHFGG